MGLTLEDLKPKNFTIKIEDIELTCSPLRLSHVLEITKIGKVMESPRDFSKNEILQAEKDMDALLAELVPELKDVALSVGHIMSIIEQVMETIEPSDNKELKEKGVDLNGDPKAKMIG